MTRDKDREPRTEPAFGPRQVAGFLVRCLVIYSLLVVPWPGVKDAYAAYLRAGGNLLFGSWGSRGKIELRALPPGETEWDTLSVLTNLERKKSGEAKHNTWDLGYVPTAALVALVLATPVPWARRIRALIWGLLLVNAFVAFRMGLGFLGDFCSNQPFALYVVRPFWRPVLRQVVDVFLFAPAAYFAGPACIWLLVTFRRSDWNAIFGKA